MVAGQTVNLMGNLGWFNSISFHQARIALTTFIWLSGKTDWQSGKTDERCGIIQWQKAWPITRKPRVRISLPLLRTVLQATGTSHVGRVATGSSPVILPMQDVAQLAEHVMFPFPILIRTRPCSGSSTVERLAVNHRMEDRPLPGARKTEL